MTVLTLPASSPVHINILAVKRSGIVNFKVSVKKITFESENETSKIFPSMTFIVSKQPSPYLEGTIVWRNMHLVFFHYFSIPIAEKGHLLVCMVLERSGTG